MKRFTGKHYEAMMAVFNPSFTPCSIPEATGRIYFSVCTHCGEPFVTVKGQSSRFCSDGCEMSYNADTKDMSEMEGYFYEWC